jgi:hypothetical protein
MIIYLAARYSRRLELCGYRDQLTALGHQVPARWLNGGHQIANDGMPLGETGERAFEDGSPEADHLRAKFARDDLEDVLAADLLVAFTEAPRSGGSASRGGRHVELGIALGAKLAVTGWRSRSIAVVGPRENLFCWLDEVGHYPDWPSFLAHARDGRVTT